MDYFQKEKAESVIDHLSRFLQATEEQVGVRVGRKFLEKVFEEPVIADEFDEIYEAHQILTSRDAKEENPESDEAVDILDSFLSRVYLYKMNYIYSELWAMGYAEPTAVDEMGEMVFTYTKKANGGKGKKFKEIYDKLRDE